MNETMYGICKGFLISYSLPSDFFDDKAKGKAASLKLGNYSSSEDDEQDDSTQTSVTPAPTASTGLPSGEDNVKH